MMSDTNDNPARSRRRRQRKGYALLILAAGMLAFCVAAGTLYEVSIKSNLLLLLYEPGDDQGIGGVIQSRMSEAGMPENLWMGVVTAINNKAPQGELKQAVFKMHDEVAAYLGQKAE